VNFLLGDRPAPSRHGRSKLKAVTRPGAALEFPMHRIALIAGTPLLLATSLWAQAPRKETVEGIRNFTVVDPTIGCAGATEARVMPELARRGYRAVLNLRLATEAGAAIEESRRAAEAAGLTYIHLPFDGQKPDPVVADAFIRAVSDPGHQPVFIHCVSANRVSALLLAKRLVVDGWTEVRALEEAKIVGPPSPALQKFALSYAAARRQ
jgi:protein tyrosine phosphatase (PTP) superfamily phosphohydrolase (DUF442 family)